MVGSQKFASTDATTIRQHCQVYASSQNDGALEIICVCVCACAWNAEWKSYRSVEIALKCMRF